MSVSCHVLNLTKKFDSWSGDICSVDWDEVLITHSIWIYSLLDNKRNKLDVFSNANKNIRCYVEKILMLKFLTVFRLWKWKFRSWSFQLNCFINLVYRKTVQADCNIRCMIMLIRIFMIFTTTPTISEFFCQNYEKSDPEWDGTKIPRCVSKFFSCKEC